MKSDDQTLQIEITIAPAKGRQGWPAPQHRRAQGARPATHPENHSADGSRHQIPGHGRPRRSPRLR